VAPLSVHGRYGSFRPDLRLLGETHEEATCTRSDP
jgi:hypothetical protein